MTHKPINLLTIFFKSGAELTINAISVMIEGGFLKVIDKNCVLQAYNTNEVSSYKLSIEFPPTR